MRKTSYAGWLLLLSLVCGGPGAPGLWRGPVPFGAFLLLEDLSPKDRLQNFEKAWKAIRDNYYDPTMNGVNWEEVHARYLPQVQAAAADQDYYAVLNRMAAELHDAHTRILSPEQAERFKHHQNGSLGFSATIIGDALVVIEVRPDTDAARAGVEPGMIVEGMDGKPLAERLKEAAARVQESSSERATRRLLYATAISGETGTTATIEFSRADGSRFQAVIKRDIVPTVVPPVTKLLPSGNAYIRLDSFLPPSAQQFKEALGQFPNAPGLIIDLRRNPGGQQVEVADIAGNFFRDNVELAEGRRRTGGKVPLRATRDKQGSVYEGPVIVLVGEPSASASELFAASLQELGRAKVVGARTCGCVVGNNHPVELKGGAQVRISEISWFTLHGRRLEGEGVIPDK
ncbi:MAG TPA: S41 family peptidase, partial [Alphaproteobacteria bacterium]|nr:S41 family peptidase [Alphaproteobacteria bacterium]